MFTIYDMTNLREVQQLENQNSILDKRGSIA